MTTTPSIAAKVAKSVLEQGPAWLEPLMASGITCTDNSMPVIVRTTSPSLQWKALDTSDYFEHRVPSLGVSSGDIFLRLPIAWEVRKRVYR